MRIMRSRNMKIVVSVLAVLALLIPIIGMFF